VGSEGDLFRARAAELPPRLDTARTAFGQVARALDDFAEVLAAAQRRMAGTRDQAEQTFAALAGGGRLEDWAPGKPLPEAPGAAIDDAKFLKYSMDPTNPNNKGKSKA
jgi:hypothetical protein